MGAFGVGVLLVWALPLPKNLIELFSPIMQGVLGQVGAAFVPGLSVETQGPLPLLTTGQRGSCLWLPPIVGLP